MGTDDYVRETGNKLASQSRYQHQYYSFASDKRFEENSRRSPNMRTVDRVKYYFANFLAEHDGTGKFKYVHSIDVKTHLGGNNGEQDYCCKLDGNKSFIRETSNGISASNRVNSKGTLYTCFALLQFSKVFCLLNGKQ